MNEALAHLNQLIDLGAEFPDAVHSTIIAFDVTLQQLEAEYDAQYN